MPIILATWEAGIRKSEVPDQPRQKVQGTSSQPIKVGCSGTHISSQLGRAHKQEDGGCGLGISVKPYSKSTYRKKKKKGWGVWLKQ
jgi:hypothetical protein